MDIVLQGKRQNPRRPIGHRLYSRVLELEAQLEAYVSDVLSATGVKRVMDLLTTPDMKQYYQFCPESRHLERAGKERGSSDCIGESSGLSECKTIYKCCGLRAKNPTNQGTKSGQTGESGPRLGGALGPRFGGSMVGTD